MHALRKQSVATLFGLTVLLFGMSAHHALAAPSRAPVVERIDIGTREVVQTIAPFGLEYTGGIAVTTGDLDGDRSQEMVFAQSGGPDADGVIRVFSADGTPRTQVRLAGTGFEAEELSLATGDVDGDGKDELILSSPTMDRSVVAILNQALRPDPETAGLFTAFPNTPHGATVAVGNVTGDDRAEILIASGIGATPQIHIVDHSGQQIGTQIVPFAEEQRAGLQVQTANTTGGEYDDLLVALQTGAQTWVKHYDIDDLFSYPVRAEFQAWTRQYYSGLSLEGFDTDGNGTEEVLVAPRGDQQAELRWFRGDGEPVDVEPVWVFEEDFRGGVDIHAVGDQVLVAPRHQVQRAPHEQQELYGDRWIEVQRAEQRQILWEEGYIRNAYLISTGLSSTPTPPGEFEITKKLASHVYDGEDYFYPNTPWNLRFIEGGAGSNYYFHTAYWHNNFGTPQSHGCVNMRVQDAEFLFQWADIGTKVWVH